METEIRAAVKRLMGQVERKEDLNEKDLALVKEAFEKASHDGPCPCGSGRKFGECCKLDWVILRDRPAVEEAADAAGVVAFPDKVAKEDQGEIEWLFKIGQHPKRGMVLEATPRGMQIAPQSMAEMLLTAYHVTNFNAVMANVQAMMQQRRPGGPALRSAFKPN